MAKLLNIITKGRARPSKEKPNNRARKLQGAKPTPIRANRVGEVLRKMFTLAIGWGWRADNPASGFKKRIENERERFLSQDEIGKLPAEALDAAEDQRGAGVVRLCMLTGSRVGEVRQARFEQFNLELGSWSSPPPAPSSAEYPPHPRFRPRLRPSCASAGWSCRRAIRGCFPATRPASR